MSSKEWYFGKGVLFLLVGLLLAFQPGYAQLIQVKTAPIATGSQFQLFPNEQFSLGGVSIAYRHPLADAFTNPAKAVRLQRGWAFSSPTFYQVTGDDGGARSLPVGALFQLNDEWFGGFGMALQQLDATPPDQVGSGSNLLRNKSANNHYVTGIVGRQVAENWSLAGTFYWANLQAMDGVELLYPNSDGVQQDGHLIDIRVGLLKDVEKNYSMEALLLFNNLDMMHKTGHSYIYYDQPRINTTDTYISSPPQTQTYEENKDKTSTLGLHLGYEKQLSPLVKIGAIMTGNYKWHPKIPNYELMNIPRDPGNSLAFDLGGGIAYSENDVTLGLDLILEPIHSNTWANAAENQEDANGNILVRKGEKTVDNNFSFFNFAVKTGMNWQISPVVDLNLGGAVRSIDYTLKQKDFVAGTRRKQDESWSEWIWSWGFGLNFDHIRFDYLGSAVTGTGQPGVARRRVVFDGLSTGFAGRGDFVIAPDGSLALQDATVITHQLMITVPF